MNEMMNVNEVQTMSSREIAELTGKLHRHVCRDIRVMLCSLYGGSEGDYIRNLDLVNLTNQGVSCVQYDTSNPNGWEYRLDKDNTLCLVSGYNAYYFSRSLKGEIAKHFTKDSNFCETVLARDLIGGKIRKNGIREKAALDTIEQLLGIKLVRQYSVLGRYRIDGYDSVNNVAYEIDEEQHFTPQHMDADRIREKNIKDVLGCEFVRIRV